MTIKRGSTGRNVEAWERFMRRQGYYTKGAKGSFGRALEAATMQFQEHAGCFGDGIVGPITASFAEQLGFEGFDGAPEMQALADAAGIPPEVLQAILKVESSGDSSAMRFEPHLFLRARPDLKNCIPYTPQNNAVWSNKRDETDRQAFEYARRHDAAEAIRSSSWGAFQVLGQHLLDLAEGHPGDALEAFDRDPVAVSDKLVAAWFSKNQRARIAANELDFQALARAYNGPQYAKHEYDKRLRKAWQQARLEG
jgi:peptidoglycan hydrolase-like protein with peptidoglycan-binding domain